MVMYHLRISGGPTRQQFEYGGFIITQAEMTDVLSEVDDIKVYKQCKGKCNIILIPDTASGASASAKKATEDGAREIHFEKFITSLSQEQCDQFEDALSKIMAVKEKSKKNKKKSSSSSSVSKPKISSVKKKASVKKPSSIKKKQPSAKKNK